MFFANYGVTDRFDVGAAIPIVSVQMAGSVTSTIVRTATDKQPCHPQLQRPGFTHGRRNTFRHRPGRHPAAREVQLRPAATPMRSPPRSIFACRRATKMTCWAPARRRRRFSSSRPASTAFSPRMRASVTPSQTANVSDLTADVNAHGRAGQRGKPIRPSRRLLLIRACRTKSTTPSGSAPRHIRG